MTHNPDEAEDDYANAFDLYHSSGNARDEDRPAQREVEGQPDGSNSKLDLEDMEVHDLLVMSRKLLLTKLLESVHGGYASPQEMAILAKLLKDNGMVMGDPFEGGSKGGNGAPQRQPLPTFTRPEYEP